MHVDPYHNNVLYYIHCTLLTFLYDFLICSGVASFSTCSIVYSDLSSLQQFMNEKLFFVNSITFSLMYENEWTRIHIHLIQTHTQT